MKTLIKSNKYFIYSGLKLLCIYILTVILLFLTEWILTKWEIENKRIAIHFIWGLFYYVLTPSFIIVFILLIIAYFKLKEK